MGDINVLPGQMIKLSVKLKDWVPEAGSAFSKLHWCVFGHRGLPGHPPPITGGHLDIAQVGGDKPIEPVVQVPIMAPGPAYVYMAFGAYNPAGQDPNNRIPPGAVSRQLNVGRLPGT